METMLIQQWLEQAPRSARELLRVGGGQEDEEVLHAPISALVALNGDGAEDETVDRLRSLKLSADSSVEQLPWRHETHEVDQVVTSEFPPAQYKVCGIQQHEMPVIGVYIDEHIIPGFRYHVRQLGPRGHRLFSGSALRLQSIGKGVGRRITFAGESLNTNENYFWSDSYPHGYAFSFEALRSGMRFTAFDGDDRQIAYVTMTAVDPVQAEVTTQVEADCCVTVAVRFLCSVEYAAPPGGLLNALQREDDVLATGHVTLVKKRGAREASLTSVAVLECASLYGYVLRSL